MSESEAENRLYSKRHTWVEADLTTHQAVVGITEYLAETIGQIKSVDMPQEEDELDVDSACIHLHADNRIHPLRSPLSGRVLEINEDVLDNPGLLHINPYKNWLYKMEFDVEDELELLMDSQRYMRFTDQL